MAFTVATYGGAGILYNKTTTTTPYTLLPSSSRRTLHIVSAKKISSRSRRNQPTETVDEKIEPRNEVEIPFYSDEDWPFEWRPPGTYKDPDFFEGSQWNTVGFVGEWLWILGVLFAVFGGGYAAINYNLGASDFKETPAYKESQSQELLEQPETSESDIFDSNPTEVAPSLN
ncbi:hypothetical protein MtrunA17_Chr6g0484641 [Medicago truncatula]|uniref:Transmembrane protein, putative n=1 Tax=Medicago truncatula TaxID=3880 RepID=A0A072UB75_MEDTR|nr:uncharacterized protein LOC25496853 [Medicago truncatula]KEH27044.1 transmembrane protein, putative [Medicago truncatula]RHN52818.1 hypothetical protein MtrunA17_Chr6g0484641 [Medicago truncatula]